MLHDVGFAVEIPKFLTFCHLCAYTGFGKESRNTSPSCAQFLGQRALRGEFKRQFACKVLALKLFVFAHIR